MLKDTRRQRKTSNKYDQNKRRKEEANVKWKIRSRNKLLFVGLFFSFSICFLIFRVYSLKATYGEEYGLITKGQQEVRNSTEQRINPNRGSMFDRNGQLLASSHTAYKIILDIRKLDAKSEEIQNNVFENLNHHLGISIEELRGHLAKDANGNLIKDTHYYVLAEQIERATALSISDGASSDVHLESESIRSYTFDTLASGILGFRRGDSYWGLERQYNSYLTGTPGRLFRTYSSARATTNTQIDAQDGLSLITTIDSNIQRFTDEAVVRVGRDFEPEEAVAVVMNPQTGEILAMSTYPLFNANDPGNFNYLGNENLRYEYESLEPQDQLNKLLKTWANFSISGSYELGSTYKPLVAAAALDEGVISRGQMFSCSGGKQVAEYYIQCWNWRRGGCGNQTLTEAIANSCNVAFMDIGIALGRDNFYEYQRNFGFGQKTGIDLPGEFAAETLLHTRERLNITELATGAMGQGFNATSIQLLTAFSSLLNGGNIMQPYVVSQVVDGNNRTILQNTPQIVRKVISEDTANYLRRDMQAVVSPIGTGRALQIEGYSIGGKTGTGEQGIRGSEAYTYSFVSYLTAENPEYIALVVIHKPKNDGPGNTSSTTVTPVIKELLEKIIQYKGIQPSIAIDEIAGNNRTENSRILIDYEGQDTISVTRSLNSLGVNFEISGSGDIIGRQMPRAGFAISDGLVVYLHLAESGNDGVETILVPDVISVPVSTAKNILASVGFEYMIVDVYGDYVDGDTDEDGELLFVTMQMPSIGAKMLRGSQVRLIVDSSQY